MALYSKLSWGELKKNTERVESFLDKFDLISDLDNSTTVSPAISSVFAAIL